MAAVPDASYANRVDGWRARHVDDIESLRADLWRYLPGPIDLIDYGCNTGQVMELLQSSHIRCRGADVNASALSEARAKGFKVARTDPFGQTYFARSSVDAVICLATIAHIKHWRHALDEMDRLLKVDGLLVIDSPEPNYDRLCLPWLLLRGYKSDPTIVRAQHSREIISHLKYRFDLIECRPMGVRLPAPLWPLIKLRSGYRLILRKAR